MKCVLDVGNCGPDHAAIQRLLTRYFAVTVRQAHGLSDTLAAVEAGGIDLVLVNRKLDADYSDGIEVIRAIKGRESTRGVPVMLVTNYADHQQAAAAIGALPGFGKLEFDLPATRDRLAAALGE